MEFASHTLANGLEIAAECNGEAHSSALTFFVKTGSRDETAEEAGVSHFLEHMLFKGTPKRSADDVNRRFDEIGAHYNAFTNEESTVFYAAVLPEYLEEALDLLSDILRPSLRAADFETEKKVILEEICMYDDQPPFGADEKCRAAFYGTHPLGNSVLGSVGSVGDLPVEAMLAYFGRRYSPDNIALIATGRVDFDGLVRATESRCGHWEPSQPDRLTPSPDPNAGFTVIHKETATQQYAVQLSPGPTATDEDRYEAKLLATVLGDESGSRLYWDLIDPGRAEHVSLSHGEYQDAGLMMTYLACDPTLAAENLQRILDLYRLAETEGITAAELEQAKSKIRSRIVLSSERPRGRLFTVASDWVQRSQYRSVADDLDAIARIDVEAVNRVLARYPLTRNTTITIGPLDNVPTPK